MRIPPTKQVPWSKEKILSNDKHDLLSYLRALAIYLRETYETTAQVVNYNVTYHRPRYVAQDTKPTPKTGELLVWHNTAAASGAPTHYLLYNDNGNVVSFASQETA